MNPARLRVLEGKAEGLIRDLSTVCGCPTDPSQLLPIDPKQIAYDLLGLSVDFPYEIPTGERNVEIAGLMDRRAQTISIALKFPAEQRRFTAAHEIAHYLLHGDQLLRRDRPMNGGDRGATSDRREQEANMFAAMLIMPKRLLVTEFESRFGGPIEVATLSDDVCAGFGSEALQGIGALEARHKSPEWLARIAARAAAFAGIPFQTLAGRFGVSVEAMAVRLKELELVH